MVTDNITRSISMLQKLSTLHWVEEKDQFIYRGEKVEIRDGDNVYCWARCLRRLLPPKHVAWVIVLFCWTSGWGRRYVDDSNVGCCGWILYYSCVRGMTGTGYLGHRDGKTRIEHWLQQPATLTIRPCNLINFGPCRVMLRVSFNYS